MPRAYERYQKKGGRAYEKYRRTSPLGPSQETEEDVAHPDISRLYRSQLVELDPEDAVATLRKGGFEAERIPEGGIRVRRPGEPSWKRVDPSRFEPLEDIGDISPLAAKIVAAAPLTAKATAVGAAAGGPFGWATGPLAGGLAFGAQMAGMEALSQGGLKALGNEVSLKGAGRRIAEEGAYGALGEAGGQVVARGAGALFRAGKGLARGVKTAARQVPYSVTEFAEAAAKARAAGKDPRPVLEELLRQQGGKIPADLSAMPEEGLIALVQSRQPGAAARAAEVAGQAGKLIDESAGEDMRIVTTRRLPKEDRITGEVVAPAGSLREFKQARYGPYEGVKSLEEIREAFKGMGESDIRAFIQKEFGEARPITVTRHRVLKSGKRGAEQTYEVSLQDMPRNELLEWMYENQKGQILARGGTSKALKEPHELRTVLEMDKPVFESNRSWRDVNLRGIQSVRTPRGEIDAARPGMLGRLGRRVVGARGPLSQDLMTRLGNVGLKAERALKAPLNAVVGNIPWQMRRSGAALGALGFGGPIGKTIGLADLAGDFVGAMSRVARRDSGNLVEKILSHADVPANIARQAQRAHELLKTKGIDAYRAAMQALVHNPEFQAWVEGQE